MNRAQMSYSPEVKRAIVEELERGELSLREAAARGHTSVGRVQQWLKEFGRYQPKRDVLEVVMKSEEEKIAALEKALAEAHLKLLVHEKIIELASKKYKVDLKKAFGSPPSSSAGGSPKPGSVGSAGR
jgi:transposase-like protein